VAGAGVVRSVAANATVMRAMVGGVGGAGGVPVEDVASMDAVGALAAWGGTCVVNASKADADLGSAVAQVAHAVGVG